MLDSTFVSDLLRTHGLEQYVPVFQQHDIAEDVFFYLDGTLLTEMGVTVIADRLKILKLVHENKPAGLQARPADPELLALCKRIDLNESLIREMYAKVASLQTQLADLESAIAREAENDDGEDEEDDGIVLATPGILTNDAGARPNTNDKC